MMRDRGYDVSEEIGILSYSFEEFVELYKNFAASAGISFRKALSREYVKNDNYTTHVYYSEDSQKDINKSHIVEFFSFVSNTDANSYIYITPTKLNSNSSVAVRQRFNRIQTFMDSDLIIDPTEHVMTPVHTALTEEESVELLERSGWNANQLPKLLSIDNVVKWYDFRKGQIVRIDRFNPIEGTMVDNYLIYRIVEDSELGELYEGEEFTI